MLTRADETTASIVTPDPDGGGIDLGGTVDLDTPGDEILANANPDQQALRERLLPTRSSDRTASSNRV